MSSTLIDVKIQNVDITMEIVDEQETEPGIMTGMIGVYGVEPKYKYTYNVKNSEIETLDTPLHVLNDNIRSVLHERYNPGKRVFILDEEDLDVLIHKGTVLLDGKKREYVYIEEPQVLMFKDPKSVTTMDQELIRKELAKKHGSYDLMDVPVSGMDLDELKASTHQAFTMCIEVLNDTMDAGLAGDTEKLKTGREFSDFLYGWYRDNLHVYQYR